MTNTGCLNRRLVSAILHAPSSQKNPTTLSYRPLTPKDWVRSITSSSSKYASSAPSVSFGAENDGLIASYMEKNKRPKKRNAKKPIPTLPAASEDEFEISGFIDRSKKSTKRFATPMDDALKAPDDIEPSSKLSKQSKKRKPENKDGADLSPGNGKRSEPAQVRRIDTDGLVRKHKQDPWKLTIREGGHSVGGSREIPDTSESLDADSSFEHKEPEPWMIQKNALKEKFKEGWNPRKKLSPDAMQGIKGLHEQDPTKYTTELLAEQFKVSPEAIRRILKSQWLTQQSPEQMQERRERWARRHDRIWDQQAELGLRPKRTKDKKVEDPDQFEQDLERRRILGKI